jgi:hypothetical protein
VGAPIEADGILCSEKSIPTAYLIKWSTVVKLWAVRPGDLPARIDASRQTLMCGWVNSRRLLSDIENGT